LISVIIPVLNEELALPETLNRVLRQGGDTQVIVVDGGSNDSTRKIAQAAAVEWTITATGRARQMNAGARLSRGDWLLFLHADTWLPDDALQAIAALDRDVLAGGFHQQFSKLHWFLNFISRLHNWRCKRSRIIYGDQCLFVRRELFERIGGFPEVAILEDLLIGERILEHTKPVLLEQTVITSSRKFEQRGLSRSFFDVVVI
jgi:rSAM/selenodomain-associated transferase 2